MRCWPACWWRQQGASILQRREGSVHTALHPARRGCIQPSTQLEEAAALDPGTHPKRMRQPSAHPRAAGAPLAHSRSAACCAAATAARAACSRALHGSAAGGTNPGAGSPVCVRTGGAMRLSTAWWVSRGSSSWEEARSRALAASLQRGQEGRTLLRHQAHAMHSVQCSRASPSAPGVSKAEQR